MIDIKPYDSGVCRFLPFLVVWIALQRDKFEQLKTTGLIPGRV